MVQLYVGSRLHQAIMKRNTKEVLDKSRYQCLVFRIPYEKDIKQKFEWKIMIEITMKNIDKIKGRIIFAILGKDDIEIWQPRGTIASIGQRYCHGLCSLVRVEEAWHERHKPCQCTRYRLSVCYTNKKFTVSLTMRTPMRSQREIMEFGQEKDIAPLRGEVV